MKNFVKILLIVLIILIISGCGVVNNGAESKSGSIWMSLDGGETWEAKVKTAKNESSLAEANILSIAVNPFNSSDILFGTRSHGIIRTTDRGGTLERTNFTSEKVYGLAFNPIDGRIIYASGVWDKKGKVFKTEDSGDSWQEIFTLSAEGPLVVSMTLDKKNPETLYISTSDDQVLKTEDGGQTWKNIFHAPDPIIQIAIDRRESNLVYFNVMDGGVFRSRNGGENPEDISKQIAEAADGDRKIHFIETDPNNTKWLYVTGSFGVMRSRDGGDTWEKVNVLSNSKRFPVNALAVAPMDSKKIVYGAGKTVYQSSDLGETWKTFQVNHSEEIKILQYDPGNPDVVYLGMSK